jgi:hypothetical protein
MINLHELGITIGNNSKSESIFDSLYPSFMTLEYTSPSDYVNKYWNALNKSGNQSNNIYGAIFEFIVATLLIRENILPLYLSAKVAFVPNVIYDLMLYSKERGPICLSSKTSLRERYKQADLESIALKYVHRKSLSYLITLHEKEANSVRAKIKTGDVIGLDDVILASSPQFDEFIFGLKAYEFCKPPTVEVLTSNKIITLEKLNSLK